jgi:hypothetical protein
MTDLQKAIEFRKIIDKYNLKDPDKAEEITNYITKNGNEGISPDEFGRLFNISIEDAKLFLEVLKVSIELRKKHMNK